MGIVPVGKNPQDLTYSPNGRYVYTANVDAGTVSVVDTESRTVTANIPTDSPSAAGRSLGERARGRRDEDGFTVERG